MNLEFIMTVIGSGTGGAVFIKILELYVLPKRDKKQFDEKIRDELWGRVEKLEGRCDEQNKNIRELLKENAGFAAKVEILMNENIELKNELHSVREENQVLKSKLEQHIKNK